MGSSAWGAGPSDAGAWLAALAHKIGHAVDQVRQRAGMVDQLRQRAGTVDGKANPVQ